MGLDQARPGGLRGVAADIDGAAKTLLALPGMFGALQEVGELGPAIDRIAGFEEQLTRSPRWRRCRRSTTGLLLRDAAAEADPPRPLTAGPA